MIYFYGIFWTRDQCDFITVVLSCLLPTYVLQSPNNAPFYEYSSAYLQRYLQCMSLFCEFIPLHLSIGTYNVCLIFVCLFLSISPLIPTMYASFCIFIPFHLPIGTFNVCPLLNVHSFASIPRWSTCIALRIRNQRLGKNFQFHFDGKSSSLVFSRIWNCNLI